MITPIGYYCYVLPVLLAPALMLLSFLISWLENWSLVKAIAEFEEFNTVTYPFDYRFILVLSTVLRLLNIMLVVAMASYIAKTAYWHLQKFFTSDPDESE